MRTTEKSKTLIIGVGNPDRGDDAAGILVARQLKRASPEGFEVIEQIGDGAALMDAWQGFDTVILVDAVQSGAPPGTIHRLDARAQPIPSRFFHCSTHAFGVAEAIETARALDRLPPRVLVFGIEGNNFGAGEEISDKISAACTEVAARIRERLPAPEAEVATK
jgi:hydrogenase maturation protease